MAQAKSNSKAVVRSLASSNGIKLLIVACLVAIAVGIVGLSLVHKRRDQQHIIVEQVYSSGAVLSGRNTSEGLELFQIQLSGREVVRKTSIRDVHTLDRLDLDNATIAEWQTWGASSEIREGLTIVDLLAPPGMDRETWIRAVYAEDECIFITITYEGEDVCPYEISIDDSHWFGLPTDENKLPPEVGRIKFTDQTVLWK